jgi:hypothetical protein
MARPLVFDPASLAFDSRPQLLKLATRKWPRRIQRSSATMIPACVFRSPTRTIRIDPLRDSLQPVGIGGKLYRFMVEAAEKGRVGIGDRHSRFSIFAHGFLASLDSLRLGY